MVEGEGGGRGREVEIRGWSREVSWDGGGGKK